MALLLLLNFLSRSNCESGFKVVPVALGGEKKRWRDKSKVASYNAHNVPLEGKIPLVPLFMEAQKSAGACFGVTIVEQPKPNLDNLPRFLLESLCTY